MGEVSLSLSDSNKNYIDEIAIEEEIEKFKNYLDGDIKEICNWFYRNFDSEFQRSISMIREESNQGSVSAIGNQVKQKSLGEIKDQY